MNSWGKSCRRYVGKFCITHSLSITSGQKISFNAVLCLSNEARRLDWCGLISGLRVVRGDGDVTGDMLGKPARTAKVGWGVRTIVGDNLSVGRASER